MKRLAFLLLLLAAGWMGLGAALVASGLGAPAGERAEAAIVLGAAIRADGAPSPVYAARLDHAAALYRARRVARLVLTGGQAEGLPRSEAAAGRAHVAALGVPPSAILLEERSRTTRQNLVEARAVLRRHGIGRVLLVSDPLHLPRAMRMAADLGLDARPSPAPGTRYRSLRTRLPFYLRESFFMTAFVVAGV